MERLSRLTLAFVMAISLVLAACGTKGPPQLPEGVTDDFPRKFPSE